MIYWQLAIFPLAAYVIGSTPFGMIIGRLKGVDLRRTGSGNVGATNVGRVLGRKWGYLCFLLDTGKALACTLSAVMLVPPSSAGPTPLEQTAWLLAGMGVVLGHVFSFWLRGRGGKGVATALGVVLGIYPYFTLAGLAAFGIWIAVTLITRYVSVGSIVAAVSFLALFATFNWPPSGLWPLGAFATAVMALIVLRHRQNIRRLLNGTENKIGKKK